MCNLTVERQDVLRLWASWRGTRHGVSGKRSEVVTLAQGHTLGPQNIVGGDKVEVQVGLDELEQHDTGCHFEFDGAQFPVQKAVC